jgi:hypothetical protein
MTQDDTVIKQEEIDNLEDMHCHIVTKIQQLRKIACDLEEKVARRNGSPSSNFSNLHNIDSSVQLETKEDPNSMVEICDGSEILGRDF